MGIIDTLTGRPALRAAQAQHERRTQAISELARTVAQLEEREWIYRYGDGTIFSQSTSHGLPATNRYLLDLERAQWFFTASGMNSDACGALPGVAQRAGGDGEDEWIRDRTSPLSALLRRPLGPTSHRQWTWRRLMATIWLHLDLLGECYLLQLRSSDGRLLGLVPVNPDHIVDQELDCEDELAQSQSLQVGSKKLDPDEYVRIAAPSPWGRRGRSRYRAALDSINIDDTLHRRQSSNLRNRIAPGLIFAIEGILGLSPEMKKAKMAELKDDYASSERDGRPMIVSKGDEILGAPDLRGQLDYEQVRSQAKEEILGICGVPIAIFDSGSQTYDNFRTALRCWYDLTIVPGLELILEAITAQAVAPLYGDSVRLWYDVGSSELGLLLLESRCAAAKGLVDLGYPTNMAAAKVGLGMPHVPELDTPNVQWIVAGRGQTDVGNPAQV